MSTVPVVTDIRFTIGAALAGCIVAVGFILFSQWRSSLANGILRNRLSAVLAFQTFLYFQIFPNDSTRYKFLVAWIWLVDAAHTVLICTGVWHYAILNFGNPAATAVIVPGFALNNVMTTTITFSVNLFYLSRIHKLSRGNWFFTVPIAILCFSRLFVSYSTTIVMFRAKTFHTFLAEFKPVLISSLSVSAATELAIAGSRWYFLKTIRSGYTMPHEAVDAVMVFTVNDGIMTCAVILISGACFLTMPHYWVFTAVFFSIGKMSGNSLLATLNLRNWYRHRHTEPQALNIGMKRSRGDPNLKSNTPSATHRSLHPADKMEMNSRPGKVEVYVDHQVEFVEEFPLAERGGYGRDSPSNKSVEIA